MINIIENNKKFAELVIEILENKYDISFAYYTNYYTSKPDDKCSILSISFSINLKDNVITAPIHYRVQSIDDVVNTISEKIDALILNSYLK
jgi:hypothetical protein